MSEGESGNQIRQVMGIMNGPIAEALQSGAAPEVLELWLAHTEHISKVYKNGGKCRGRHNSTYHPMLMTWAITLRARTSSGTYNNNEVAKLMMLPHIRTVYKKTAELITTKNNKTYCLHMHKIRSIGEHARQEGWTSHQRIGAIA